MNLARNLSCVGVGLAKKSLGQNFLVDSNVAYKIISHLDVQPQDKVLEIGPGQGALTFKLLELTPDLTVIEKDFKLAAHIKSFKPEIDVIVMDVMDFAWQALAGEYNWKLIGNLPYNIASPLIWDLVSGCYSCKRAVFTVQKEVAQRIVAKPGSKKYGAISVWVQSFVVPKLLFSIGSQVFRPRPKVDSAVISMDPVPQEKRFDCPQKLANLLHLCFQQRRKQLGTILKRHWTPVMSRWIASHGLDTRVRPEQLSPGQFQELALLLG